ncbi:MAG: 50S ribosomal protein L18 [Candidatus Obscuribacterales bacterium]
MITKPNRKETRMKRHRRIRRRIWGSTERPRLCVYRSNRHIYAQVVDDSKSLTIAQASTLDPELKDLKKSWDKDAAKSVGELIAKRVLEKGHKFVVFDRGGYIYHGRIASVADGAREAGLNM